MSHMIGYNQLFQLTIGQNKWLCACRDNRVEKPQNCSPSNSSPTGATTSTTEHKGKAVTRDYGDILFSNIANF